MVGMPEVAVIVPARLRSTRFPKKLLHPIAGKPLLLHVAERIAAEAPEFPLYFAVDDRELADVLESAGFAHVMTSPDHASGSDRIAEANEVIGAACVVNVQADEPLVTGKQIRDLAGAVTAGAPMATLAIRFERARDFLDPNQVKVVWDENGRALYFSRATVPFPREEIRSLDDAWVAAHPCWRHLGLYAYQGAFLKTLTALPPGRLEQIERLEQLRVLENGYAIAVAATDEPTIGIDTPEDAERFSRHLSNGP